MPFGPVLPLIPSNPDIPGDPLYPGKVKDHSKKEQKQNVFTEPETEHFYQ